MSGRSHSTFCVTRSSSSSSFFPSAFPARFLGFSAFPLPFCSSSFCSSSSSVSGGGRLSTGDGKCSSGSPVYNPYAPPLLPPHLQPPLGGASRENLSAVGAEPFSSCSSSSPSSSSTSFSSSSSFHPAPPRQSHRWAWTPCFEALKRHTQSLYSTFYYTKANVKYAMVFAFPMFLWATRWRAEKLVGYHLYIEDEILYPDYSQHKLPFNKQWSNGKKLYLSNAITVADLKARIYEGREKVPEHVKVCCHGRMMEDTDNVALATRAFCKRDPKLLLCRDDINLFPSNASAASTATSGSRT